MESLPNYDGWKLACPPDDPEDECSTCHGTGCPDCMPEDDDA